MNRTCAFAIAFLFFLYCIPHCARGQSFMGYHATSYAGVYGTLYNPANILDHRVRADINLVGFSAAMQNNVVKLALGNSDDPVKTANPITKSGRFGFSYDALGPGVMVRLSDKNAIAVTTRFRVQANIDKLDPSVLNLALQEDVAPLSGNAITIHGAAAQVHAWNELAFTYSQQIGISDFGVWKAAVSLKVLGGQGGAYLTSNRLAFTYNDSLAGNQELREAYGGAVGATGNINVNYSDFMDDWDNEYQYKFFRQPGLGADIGITYEYRDVMQVYETAYNSETLNYKWKAGASISDIGSIRYRSSPNSYNTHLSGQTYIFNDLQPPEDSTSLVSIANFYKRKFPGTKSDTHFSMSLPTTLHLMFDYSFNQWLSAEGHLSLPIVASQVPYYIGTHILPVLSVTPRAELPWIGLYVPLSYQFAGGFQMGGGLRLGPLVIGSGSLINIGLLRKTKAADGYFILRIPFFGYREYNNEDVPPPHTILGKIGRLIFNCPKRL